MTGFPFFSSQLIPSSAADESCSRSMHFEVSLNLRVPLFIDGRISSIEGTFMVYVLLLLPSCCLRTISIKNKKLTKGFLEQWRFLNLMWAHGVRCKSGFEVDIMFVSASLGRLAHSN